MDLEPTSPGTHSHITVTYLSRTSQESPSSEGDDDLMDSPQRRAGYNYRYASLNASSRYYCYSVVSWVSTCGLIIFVPGIYVCMEATTLTHTCMGTYP